MPHSARLHKPIEADCKNDRNYIYMKELILSMKANPIVLKSILFCFSKAAI
jgi:hypothetical protein